MLAISATTNLSAYMTQFGIGGNTARRRSGSVVASPPETKTHKRTPDRPLAAHKALPKGRHRHVLRGRNGITITEWTNRDKLEPYLRKLYYWVDNKKWNQVAAYYDPGVEYEREIVDQPLNFRKISTRKELMKFYKGPERGLHGAHINVEMIGRPRVESADEGQKGIFRATMVGNFTGNSELAFQDDLRFKIDGNFSRPRIISRRSQVFRVSTSDMPQNVPPPKPAVNPFAQNPPGITLAEIPLGGRPLVTSAIPSFPSALTLAARRVPI